jgi:hypothetical protein
VIKMLSVTAGYVIIAGAGLSVAISMYLKDRRSRKRAKQLQGIPMV